MDIALLQEFRQRAEEVASVATTMADQCQHSVVRTHLECLQRRALDLCNACVEEEWLANGSRRPHENKKGFTDPWSPESFQGGELSTSTIAWRRSLSQPASSLSPEDQKQLFNLFFAYDLYGRYRSSDTILASRGVVDSAYVRPPAAISLSMIAAVAHSHFGYSDSLGHLETRAAIANFETAQRGSICDPSGVAVGFGSLTSLALLAGEILRDGLRRPRVLVPVPTYSPVIAALKGACDITTFPANWHLEFDLQEMGELIKRKRFDTLLLSLPGNPTTITGCVHSFINLLDLCESVGTHVLIDQLGLIDNETAAELNPANRTGVTVVYSFSKHFHVPGLKLSYVRSSKTHINRMYSKASILYGSPPSSLYLAATTAANLGTMQLSGNDQLPVELEECTSREELIQEFRIWSRMEILANSWYRSQFDLCSKARNWASINRAIPTSYTGNYTILLTLRAPSYKVFLEILRHKNVSVYPGDCLYTSGVHKTYIRVSHGQRPSEWVRALTSAFEVCDDMYAIERRNEWLPDEQFTILTQFGQYVEEPGHGLWGHLMRAHRRLSELCPKASSEMYCAMNLHDLGKFIWLARKNAIPWKVGRCPCCEKEEACECGEHGIARSLLTRVVNAGHVIPNKSFSLLMKMWSHREAGAQSLESISLDNDVHILIMADRSSDFALSSPSDLRVAMNLKQRQCRRVYCELDKSAKEDRRNTLELVGRPELHEFPHIQNAR